MPTVLGSKELSEANKRLNAEAQSQRKVLDALSKALAIIEHKEEGQTKAHHPFDPHKLVEDIERQAAKLVEITAEKGSTFAEFGTAERVFEQLCPYGIP